MGPGEETEHRLIVGPGEEDGHSLYTIDLIKYDLKTGQRTRLTNNERFAQERGTSFSPDGRHFVSDVFIFGGGEKGRGIRLFRSDGTELGKLVGYDGYDYQDPDWGP